MNNPSPIYSAVQIILLIAPFLFLVGGILFWQRRRHETPSLAWIAFALPVMLFIGVAGWTYAKHNARVSFLNDLMVVPEQILPGRVLAVTMYGESAIQSYHLLRIGVATEVITALQDARPWRHNTSEPILNFDGASLYYTSGYGEAVAPFVGTLSDIDYISVTGHIADFITIDPARWGDLEDLGYDRGLVSLLYVASEDMPINLVTSDPLFRFASTRSTYFRLPNWSTHWSLRTVLEWTDFAPAPLHGDTRFDVLAKRIKTTLPGGQ